MSEGTRQLAPELIQSCDFARFHTLLDVGGGDGTLLAAILAATPSLRGVLLDTAAGLAEAPKRLSAAGLGDRCELVQGDFFESVPSSADAYLMKSIIHDWDDDRCVRILENCRRAMPQDGAVLIVEPVLPSKAEPSFAMLGVIMSDLNMLVSTGGRERTEAEFASLLRAAGLQLKSVTSVPGPFVNSVIEAVAS
jgi:orsellinic acid C2-O-methyltransferase